MPNNTVINPFQPAWEAAVTNLIASLGNLGAFVVLTFLFYDLPFLVYNTIQFYALKHGWWEKWRIQKGKEPNPELVVKARGDMAFLHFVYNPAVYSAIYYTWRFFTDFDLTSPLPSPLKLLGQYLICIAFEDTSKCTRKKRASKLMTLTLSKKSLLLEPSITASSQRLQIRSQASKLESKC